MDTFPTPSASLEVLERETGPAPAWTVLWLHGLGADGNDFAPIVPELVRPEWPAIRFVFPHAPVRPVTINGGVRMRAWYDIVGMDFADRADEEGVAQSVGQVEALVEREAARGVPASRVVLAGFSQGGAVALAAAVRRQTPLAGIVAMSTYLPMNPHAAERLVGEMPPLARTQPVFMAHGTADPVVPFAAGQASAERLRGLGMDVQWRAYPMAHQVCAREIDDLRDWLSTRLAV